MKDLPFNCKIGKMSVVPNNWATGGKELLEVTWVLTYTFYDKDTNRQKLVRIKNFNKYPTLTVRRRILKEFIEFEIKRLETGYNPIDKIMVKKVEEVKELPVPVPVVELICSTMPFEDALKYGDTMLTVSAETRLQETDHMLRQILAAATTLGYHTWPMDTIKKKQLREIVNIVAVSKVSKELSLDKFNRVRKVLSYYYKALMDYDIVESNLPKDLNKQKAPVKKVDVELDSEVQKKLSDYLQTNFRSYWLYLQVFYNSAPRSSEMMRLKVGDVDIPKQRIKFVIHKGQQHTEKYRVIPDIALVYWKEIIGNAPADWFVFGRGLLPSETPIRSYQIHKRWYRLITKNDQFKDIGITFYKLKHLRLTDVGDTLGQEYAASLAQENQKTIATHYDMNNSREDSKLRKSGKKF